MGVDGRMPGYMVREELQREKIKFRAAKRAWGFERRIEQKRGGELAEKCWEEVRKRGKKGKEMGGWEGERRKFFENRGVKVEEMEKRREEGRDWFEEVVKEKKRKQREERWERIRESSYNRWYREMKGEGTPEYLKKIWGENR